MIRPPARFALADPSQATALFELRRGRGLISTAGAIRARRRRPRAPSSVAGGVDHLHANVARFDPSAHVLPVAVTVSPLSHFGTQPQPLS